ncbi:MAG: 3-deoxy-D-manno-octulosonic acid transferase [bacterium]
MGVVFYTIYSALLFVALLLYAPFYVRRTGRGGRYRPDLLQRIGISPPEPKIKRGTRILLHSVSVGETRAVIPVIKELKRQRPEWEIYLTTTTGTGRNAAEQMGAPLDRILYFPIDFGIVCASFLRRTSPDCICLTETELWPNFMRAASRLHIPLILINGRISDRSFTRYRFFRPLIRPLLRKFRTLCMQSPLDARRILALGADPVRVKVTGNIKFDLSHLAMDEQATASLRSRLGIKEDRSVLVAGSTHPGEERPIVDAFTRLCSSYPELVLILVPRHVERAEGIAQMLREGGTPHRRWSTLPENARIGGGEVLIVDVIGVLARIYSLATMVIIGGSFIPHGGQNPLEPAFFGKPVIFGPHMQNFRSISALLMEAQAARMIREEALFTTLSDLLADPQLRHVMGQAARKVVDANRGSALRTCKEIMGIIEGP